MADRHATIAEVILAALRDLYDTSGIHAEAADVHPAFPIEPRSRLRRNLDRPSIVYGLFTDREALAIKTAATNVATTVSALVSAALDAAGPT